MAEQSGLREASERLDALLREVDTHADPAARQRASEIVELLMTLHRAALDRVLTLAADPAAGGPALVAQIGDDPIAGPILLAHDLHPHSVEVRVSRTVERLRPVIAARGCRVENVRVEPPAAHLVVKGLAAVQAEAAASLRQAIESAILERAPELTSVVFDARPGEVAVSGLIQITKP